MEREQITRDDFPEAGDGYDRASVDAHLVAVAAWAAALEAQVDALEVERDALRRRRAGVVLPDPGDSGAELPSTGAVPVSADVPADAPEPAGESHPGASPDHGPPADSATPGDDEVSARLVATRLALEGSERDDIVSRLAEAYELEDPRTLVDDVLTRLA
jgi:hypothetical protein